MKVRGNGTMLDTHIQALVLAFTDPQYKTICDCTRTVFLINALRLRGTKFKEKEEHLRDTITSHLIRDASPEVLNALVHMVNEIQGVWTEFSCEINTVILEPEPDSNPVITFISFILNIR